MGKKVCGEETNMQRGIKIKTLSQMFFGMGVVLFIFIMAGLICVFGKYNNLAAKTSAYVRCQKSIEQLQSGSDYLTEQSRNVVLTADPVYMQAYFDVIDKKLRENAISQLQRELDGEVYAVALGEVETALSDSNALMDYEIHAMRLISQMADLREEQIPDIISAYPLSEEEQKLSTDQLRNEAYYLVFGKQYREDKQAIDRTISHVLNNLSDRIEADAMKSAAELKRAMIVLSVLVFSLLVMLIAVFLMIELFIIRPLKIYVKCIEEERALEVRGAYEFRYLAFTYNNIFELQQENKAKMKYKLEHDILTGVYNRQAFEEQKHLLKNQVVDLAIVLIDVDHFKGVNDKYGHDIGDWALKQVGAALQASVRAKDFVARIGGDEFVILMPDVKEEEKDMIVDKLNKINDGLQKSDEGMPMISLSVGVAFSKNGYREEIYRNADTALYRAKDMGRCRIESY